MRYIPRNKYTAADGLFQRPRADLDDMDEEYEVDIDDFIDAELNTFSVASIAEEEALLWTSIRRTLSELPAV